MKREKGLWINLDNIESYYGSVYKLAKDTSIDYRQLCLATKSKSGVCHRYQFIGFGPEHIFGEVYPESN